MDGRTSFDLGRDEAGTRHIFHLKPGIWLEKVSERSNVRVICDIQHDSSGCSLKLIVKVNQISLQGGTGSSRNMDVRSMQTESDFVFKVRTRSSCRFGASDQGNQRTGGRGDKSRSERYAEDSNQEYTMETGLKLAEWERVLSESEKP